MKRFFAFLFCGILATGAHAYTERGVAVLRVMNKAAGKTTEISVPVGTVRDFDKVSIVVRSCKQSDPFDAENFYAFVQIERPDKTKVFSGWMNRNNPGKAPVQDADYDVWLVRCE